MKYFTTDWYREGQVYGVLAFPDTKEEWESGIQEYEPNGKDFKKMMLEELEWRKSDLLKFLPKSFHPYILEGTLTTEYPPDELRKMAKQWNNEFKQRRRDIGKQYLQQFDANKESLPENALQLHEKSLHDGKVITSETISDNTFVILLEGNGVGSYTYFYQR